MIPAAKVSNLLCMYIMIMTYSSLLLTACLIRQHRYKPTSHRTALRINTTVLHFEYLRLTSVSPAYTNHYLQYAYVYIRRWTRIRVGESKVA
ncbi:hypothetical protein CC78DRAFT_74258 [Lojkania enalia]|uniref:Uncharacterized protein n=1 Tax=Lojkania enalia TaxID=147567 RepID=A0A9P4MZA0_9PLEO|nr:hypothetical protein CC78DRAFT_74258 [Didymosphaeria enalia]